jgi:hypothetical protein
MVWNPAITSADHCGLKRIRKSAGEEALCWELTPVSRPKTLAATSMDVTKSTKSLRQDFRSEHDSLFVDGNSMFDCGPTVDVTRSTCNFTFSCLLPDAGTAMRVTYIRVLAKGDTEKHRLNQCAAKVRTNCDETKLSPQLS